MKKIIGISILVVIAGFLLSGCASIISKSQYAVNINSQPEGADIAITNRSGKNIFTGKTPTTITLKAKAGFFKGENYLVTFKKEGHAPHTAKIERGVDGWYICNILFGGLIGILIVDPATGAMWTLKDLHVDLDSSQQASSGNNQLQIMTLDNVPDHLTSKMVKVN